MQEKPKTAIILASASPRRKELLARLLKDFPDIDPNFSIIPAHIDESPLSGESPQDYVTRLAREKATAIACQLSPNLTHTVILAADTSVVIDGKILGKPFDDADAMVMLKELNAKTHDVITGYALLSIIGQLTDMACNFEKTRVSFRALSGAEIRDYIATSEPWDKAGAYAIQGGAAAFVDHIAGSLDNVVGLPTERLRVELTNLLAKLPKSR